MGFRKGAFKPDKAFDGEPRNTLSMNTVENAPTPEPEDEGVMQIKAKVSKKNYDYIRKEAKRAGVPMSAMVSILLDEAIQERKLYIEKVLKAV
jgi:hypothetical protein